MPCVISSDNNKWNQKDSTVSVKMHNKCYAPRLVTPTQSSVRVCMNKHSYATLEGYYLQEIHVPTQCIQPKV